MLKPSIRFVCVVGVLASIQTTFALQAARRSTAAGVFTEAQSTRGEQTFISTCGGCHTPTQFVGEFLLAWNGKTASDLLEMIRSKMPQDSPGSLPRQQYADIVAYLFEKNGLPPGKEELPSEQADLERVDIELPKP